MFATRLWYRLRCLLCIALIGCAESRADEITADRIKALPEAERSDWTRYLRRSKELAAADVQALQSEVETQGMKQALKAPEGGDFKLSYKPGDPWYKSDEAATQARVIISFQAPCGGWSKHIAYSKGPRAQGMQWTSQSDPGKRAHYLATLDNRSTTEQLLFLSCVSNAAVQRECEAAVRRGLQFIYDAQFPNGGWPQVYPLEGDYHDNITFNDDAIVHVLELLQAVATDKERFGFLNASERQQAAAALEHGIQCILKSQCRQGGKRTAWCAQHDALTLQPAPARALEPASLSGSESAHLVQFLMRLEVSNQDTIESIEAGLAWLEKVKITGHEKVKLDGKTTYRMNAQSNEIYWARFYDLETNRPIFPGRDGKIYDTFEEMAANNKVGYDYLSTQPGSILKNGQKKWRKTLSHP